MVVRCSCKKRRRRRTALCCEGKECVILFIFLWFAVFFQAMGRDDNKKYCGRPCLHSGLPSPTTTTITTTRLDPTGDRRALAATFLPWGRGAEKLPPVSQWRLAADSPHVLLVFWGLFAFFIQAQISSPLCPSEVSSSRVNTGRRHKLQNWSWLVLLNWDTYVRHILLEKQKKNNNNYTPKKFSLIFLQTSNSVSALSALSVVCIH